MLDPLEAGLAINALLILYLILRVRALHRLLIQPLPRAVTMRGVVPLDPKDRLNYFLQARNSHPKQSVRWRLYDKVVKDLAA